MGPMPEIAPTQPEQQTIPRWESRMEKIRKSSLANRERLIADHGFNTHEKQAELGTGLEKIRQTMRVTTNMNFESLLMVLQEGKVQSVYESRDERMPIVGFSPGGRAISWISKVLKVDLWERIRAERQMGIRASGTENDPHSIYGALASENGVDERVGGAGGENGSVYGDSIIILRNEKVKERTTFTYGDSFNPERKFPVVWEDVPYLKAMRDIEGIPYVEAQILGGVTTDDIEEIRIRVRPDEQETIEQKIAGVRQQFPDIKFSFVLFEEGKENVQSES